MKLIIKPYLLLFFGIVLFSCKKEPVNNNLSDFQVYSFSAFQAITTPDQGFILSGNKYIEKVDASGSLVWSNLSPYNYPAATPPPLPAYFLPLANNQIISCAPFGNALLVNQLDAQSNGVFEKYLYISDSSSFSTSKVVQLTSGDLIFMGTGTNSNGVSDSVLLVIKTNSNGVPYWNKKIKLTTDLSSVNKIIQVDANNDVVLIGNTALLNANSPDSINAAVNPGNQPSIFYAKMDSSGTLLWQKEVAFGQWLNIPTDIHVLNSNELIITGYYDISTSYNYNYQFFAYKIDNSGNSLGVSKPIGNSGGTITQDYCISSLLVPNSTNIIMVGMKGRGATPNDLTSSTIEIITLNTASMSVVSQNTYGQNQNCAAMSAIYNNDGSLSVVGNKYGFNNSGITNTFFMKIKP